MQVRFTGLGFFDDSEVLKGVMAFFAADALHGCTPCPGEQLKAMFGAVTGAGVDSQSKKAVRVATGALSH